MSPRTPETIQPNSPRNRRRTAAATIIGSIVESYDFSLFGLAAAIIFGPLFFPGISPEAQVISSFITFAVGYLGRPLGGLVFSHLGDRFGRKPMLVGTLVLMGIATISIGCLPTYATVGIWAPILLGLCRFLQGLGAGAEYVGAIVMMAETGGRRRFGLRVALPGMGVFTGIVLATGVFQAVVRLPEEALMSWGWRVPFLLAFVTLAIGLWIRVGVAETAEFQRQWAAHELVKFPLSDVLRTQWKEILIGIGINGPYLIFSTVLQVFMLSYLTNSLGVDRTVALAANLVASTMAIGTTPMFGALSDRFGRLRIWLFGLIAMAVFSIIAFPLLRTASPAVIIATMALGIGFALAALYATQGAILSALFEPRHRLTGVVFVRESTAALVGGPTPAVVASLTVAAGAVWPASAVLIGAVVIALVTTVITWKTLTRTALNPELA